MKKDFYKYIAIISLAFVTGWLFFNGHQAVTDEYNQLAIFQLSIQPINFRTIIPQVKGDETKLIEPVSLPALMEKEWDGRDFTVSTILDDNSSYTRYYITYLSGDLRISGIMNVPKGEGPFPVLILNHGYIGTSVYTNGRGLRREQDYLACRGYVVIHPDYRNHADSDDDPDYEVNFRLGYTEDVINAVTAVRKAGLPYIDGSRFGMLGHSMGGGGTQNVLVVEPDLVQAAVLFAPVSRNAIENYERWTERRPEVAKKIVEKYGLPDENPEFWQNISTPTFFDRVQAPLMIHHGTADESVPIEWSDRLSEELRELDKDVEYYIYDGQPHEFTSSWGQVMQRTVDFFDREVKG